MEASRRFATEKAFQEFCELLVKKRYDLRPSNLFPRPQGAGVDPGEVVSRSQDKQDREYDRSESVRFLKDVEIARKDFPKVAEDHHGILSEAESTWKNLVK
jgi:hypothetical protein